MGFATLACALLAGAGWMRGDAGDDGGALWASVGRWGAGVGLSFLAGFVFAFLLRRTLGKAMVWAGVLVALAWGAHQLGLVGKGDVERVRADTGELIDAGRRTADSLWSSVRPLLSSGVAVALGLWRGARNA